MHRAPTILYAFSARILRTGQIIPKSFDHWKSSKHLLHEPRTNYYRYVWPHIPSCWVFFCQRLIEGDRRQRWYEETLELVNGHDDATENGYYSSSSRKLKVVQSKRKDKMKCSGTAPRTWSTTPRRIIESQTVFAIVTATANVESRKGEKSDPEDNDVAMEL